MKISVKFILFAISFIILILLFCYGSFLFIVPVIFNSIKFNNKIEKIIYEKTGTELYTDKYKLVTHKDLSATLCINKIYLNENNKNILEADKVYIFFNPLKKQLSKLHIDYIYIDKSGLNQAFGKNQKKKISNINFSGLPETNIKRAEIIINDDTKNETFINIDNIRIYNDINLKQTVSLFNASVKSAYLRELITINNRNNIKFEKDIIAFDNLTINIGESNLQLSGQVMPAEKDYKLNIQGTNLPVYDIERGILYFLKLKKKDKNFLENFDEFSGTANINLNISKDGITGKSILKNLKAKILMFNIPVYFSNVDVNFTGQNIDTEAYGLLGNETVYTNFQLKNYSAEKRTITGVVHSLITDKFTSLYMPDIKIEGGADTTFRYYIKKSVPEFYFTIELDKGTNIFYRNASLDLTDKKRRIFAQAVKKDIYLYIKHFDYSILNDNEIKTIILGTSTFKKINNKFKIQNISCKTKEEAPVTVTGSFGKKLNGGTFFGDLNYDFNTNLLTGEFNLSNTEYNAFVINNANINADTKKIKIDAKGTYYNSNFSALLDMDNRFTDNIVIHDIDLFLDKYVIKKRLYKKSQPTKKDIQKKKEIKQKVENTVFTVEKGRIKLNKLIKNRIIIENIEIFGTLKDNIIDFKTSDAIFAKGSLRAEGTYNIDKKLSKIEFEAKNIDSDKAADMVFNLPNQIKGTANAKLYAEFKNNLEEVEACAKFSVDKGFLPQIGSTEFIIKRNNKNKKPLKIKISDIVNIDISKAKAMSSDLNGSFNIYNQELNNVEIFSKQKYLSLFIEGNYDLDKEEGDVQIWGKYNKKAREKVKILFIPLSVIMRLVFKPEETKNIYKNKLDLVPEIQASEEETEAFRVKMEGNINANDIKVELKSIK